MTGPYLPIVLFEAAVNRVLALDPATIAELESLIGKTLAIDLQGIGIVVYASPRPGGLDLFTDSREDPDVVVKGPPFALLRLLASRDDDSLLGGEVTVSGDAALMQRIKSIFDRVDIDWEEQLSAVIGDIGARQLGNFVRGLSAWGNRSRETLFGDMGEYLSEELRLTPGRLELDHFNEQVDELRDDVERLLKRAAGLRVPGPERDS